MMLYPGKFFYIQNVTSSLDYLFNIEIIFKTCDTTKCATILEAVHVSEIIILINKIVAYTSRQQI